MDRAEMKTIDRHSLYRTVDPEDLLCLGPGDFSDYEAAICRLLGVRYLTRDPGGSEFTLLWSDLPLISNDGKYFTVDSYAERGKVRSPAFSRLLKPGQIAVIDWPAKEGTVEE